MRKLPQRKSSGPKALTKSARLQSSTTPPTMATIVPTDLSTPCDSRNERRYPMIDQSVVAGLRPDTVDLLNAFGGGGLTSRSIVVANLPSGLKIDPGALILVCGPSGSGKSQTLPLILSAMGQPKLTPEPQINHRKAVIEQWPDIQAGEAIARLGPVGLGDPLTWARLPGQLSVGQYHRLELAMRLHGPGRTMVVDEWLAPLDRVTARAVAWSTARNLRRLGKGAVLITAHDDLEDDAMPDCRITVGWLADPKIEWYAGFPGVCSIIDQLTYRRGSAEDWQKLSHLHYAAGDPATMHSVHVAELPAMATPAAVAVLSWPDLHSAARNLVTDQTYRVVGKPGEIQRLNRDILKMSRLVVAPELRSVGVAGWLIRQMISQVKVRYLECVTAMGRYSNFLRRCGWNEVPQTPTQPEAELMDLATNLRMPPAAAIDADTLRAWVDTLSVRNKRQVWRAIWHVYHICKLWRRTRRSLPKVVPGPDDPRWPEAWDLASRRLAERPSYWIFGPIDDQTGEPTG